MQQEAMRGGAGISRATLVLGAVVLAAAVAAPLVVIERLEPPASTLFWKALFDAGHAILFGLQALIVLAISKLVFRDAWPSKRHYWVAFVVAMTVGVAGEASQIYTYRQASWIDVLRNALGAASFLLFVSTWDRQASERRGTRFLLRAIAVATLSIVFFPMAWLGAGYVQRARAFPVLYDWRVPWQRAFIETRRARVLPKTPGDEATTLDVPAVDVAFGRGRYPRLAIREPYPDWRGYDRLVFHVSSPLERSVGLLVRIEDNAHNHESSDRYEETFVLTGGDHRVVVPLSRIEDGPDARQLDLANIERLTLAVVRPEEPIQLSFSAIRLEKTGP